MLQLRVLEIGNGAGARNCMQWNFQAPNRETTGQPTIAWRKVRLNPDQASKLPKAMFF